MFIVFLLKKGESFLSPVCQVYLLFNGYLCNMRRFFCKRVSGNYCIEVVFANGKVRGNLKSIALGRRYLYSVTAVFVTGIPLISKLAFSGSGNRNSTVNATASYEHKSQMIALRRIDSLVSTPVDFIKYDVEGAEYEALLGTDETIKKYTPALLVSLYHRSRDIFSLTNMIKEKYGFYKLYLRRLLCVPAWEVDLIAIPNKD